MFLRQHFSFTPRFSEVQYGTASLVAVSNGFQLETVETVGRIRVAETTSLKRGVNETAPRAHARLDHTY